MSALAPAGIAADLGLRLLPVWLALFGLLAAGFALRRHLGGVGRLYDSPAGIVGLALVLFWVLVALLASRLSPFDPFAQFRAMRHALPGTIESGSGLPFLLGGDALGRDVLSRLLYGSRTTVVIAPSAAVCAYAIGIGLGLPAGYLGGPLDTALSFCANLVLAFPAILLFYLLVTPQIRETAIPGTIATLLFAAPLLLAAAAAWTRLSGDPRRLWPALLVLCLVAAVAWFQGRRLDPGLLNVFLAVTFITAPTVFRLVRGLTQDIASRDFVAAAETRGEGPGYVMLWEILPNVRGPLIVDACLRVGYITILLGTLGFFGLGVGPESPDWGSTINEGRKLLRLYAHPAVPPALALMSLVLGLNLLADALRERADD